MNPFTLLKEDHKKVKALFKEFEETGDRAFKKKEEISQKVFTELEIHTTIEEEILYPSIERAAKEKDTEELVKEAFAEHAVVKDLIDEMKEIGCEDENFAAKFKVMQENVEHHIEEEEGELFPKAKKILGDQSEEIGDEMKERKEELKEEFEDAEEDEELSKKAI